MHQITTALLMATCGLLVFAAPTAYFVKEAQVVEAAQKAIHKIELDFETAVKTKNNAQLTHILAEIKREQAAVKKIRADIEVHTESEHFETSFYERIMLECLHIRTGIYVDILKTIGQEVLGEQNGISEFPAYQGSTALQSGVTLLNNKFAALLKSTESTDHILATASKKNVTLTAAEKATVNKNLGELVKTATSIHDEAAREYHTELEKIHQEGKVLRLSQKMDTESLIDEVYFVMHFLKEFHTLFQQIEDHTP